MSVSEWHIWVVKTGKFRFVEKHINSIPEIEEYFYPTSSKEFRTDSGQHKIRRVPLFSGYLFLKYKDVPDTFYKLNKNPFITTYVGKCFGEELDKVKKLRELELINTVNKNVVVGDLVRVNQGPFRGKEGEVVYSDSTKLAIYLEVFGGYKTKTTLNRDSVDIIKRE